jgi:hypothetical protein
VKKIQELFETSTFTVNTQKQTNITFQRNPLDFNAPVPEFTCFFNSVRKSFLVVSLTSFAPRQFL